MNAQSAGGIIFNGDKICFMCYANGKLGFPKGTPDEKESLEQTAIREVQEETGLVNVRIVKKLGVLTRPGEIWGHIPVMKDIHMFLMEVDNYTQGHQDEVIEWLTPEEAFPRLFPEEEKFLKTILTA